MKSRRVVFLCVSVFFLFSNSLFGDGVLLPTYEQVTYPVDPGVSRTDCRSGIWSSDGRYFIVTAGSDQGSGIDHLASVYAWDGFSATLTWSVKYTGGEYNSMMSAWSQNNQYVAVTTIAPGSVYSLYIYEWDSVNERLLEKKRDIDGDHVAAVWHPDGQYLFTVGMTGDVHAFSWDGTTLTLLSTLDLSGVIARDLKISSDGVYLAVQTTSETNIAKWDSVQESLIDLGPGANVNFLNRQVDWRPGENILALKNNHDHLTRLYTFDGLNLTLLDEKTMASSGVAVAWSHEGSVLLVNENIGSFEQLVVFGFNGSDLVELERVATSISSIEFARTSPNKKYLLVCATDAGDQGEFYVYTYNTGFTYAPPSAPVTYGSSVSFPAGGNVSGSVTFNDGFLVGSGQELTLGTNGSVQGTIDLNGDGLLSLTNDLYLGSHINGGLLSGNGHTLFLERNLTTTYDMRLTVTSDVVIDGQGHDIILEGRAHILVDNGVTLTLRNVRLRNHLNTEIKPPISFRSGGSGVLTLYGAEIACVDDFYFDNGQLFIHDDVVITGSSRFIYKSVNPFFIDYLSNLFMDLGTTFYYDPSSVNRDLMIMNDETSRFYLHGATLKSTTTGMRLTKGTLVVDHKSYIESDAISVSEAVSFGDGTAAGDFNIEIMPGGSIWLSSGILDYNNVS